MPGYHLKQQVLVVVTNMNGINRLDLKQLRVLDALLRERNLSRVAAEMGLTQQAISEQLRKLRDLFDDRLLVRQGNAMVPTPTALELGGRICVILDAVDNLLEPTDFDPTHYEGVFNISATDYALEAILPPFLQVVRREAPGLKLIVSDFEAEQTEAQLTSGELDLVLSFPDFIPPSLPRLKLFDDCHTCVAGIDNPLHSQMLDIHRIAELPQLVVSPSRDSLQGSHDNWFAGQGLSRNIVMSVPSFKAAPDILYTTDLIAFYPSQLLPNDKVKPLNTDVKPPSFEVIAAWHTRTENSRLHQWIVNKLRQIAQR